jgi:hypothetical protein
MCRDKGCRLKNYHPNSTSRSSSIIIITITCNRRRRRRNNHPSRVEVLVWVVWVRASNSTVTTGRAATVVPIRKHSRRQFPSNDTTSGWSSKFARVNAKNFILKNFVKLDMDNFFKKVN